jgi:hypothetical protein
MLPLWLGWHYDSGGESCAGGVGRGLGKGRSDVPWIIDYQSVAEQLRGQGMRCNYYNSGAFGFMPQAAAFVRGWVGPDDPTIKPQAKLLSRQIDRPYEANLATLATKAWQEQLHGRAWVMPMSHWGYELTYGSRDWMPALIENIGVDPGLLEQRTDAAAIEFSAGEGKTFEHFIQRLLELLLSSDFMIAFPRRNALCTIHHHKQLWWLTTEPAFVEYLDKLVPAVSGPLGDASGGGEAGKTLP